jgi:hypothetical protein
MLPEHFEWLFAGPEVIFRLIATRSDQRSRSGQPGNDFG